MPRRLPHLAPVLAALFLIAGGSAARAQSMAPANAVEPAGPVELPAPDGAYAVGALDVFWVDRAREETATPDPEDARQVLARVWMPGRVGSAGPPAPYMPEIGLMRSALLARPDSQSWRRAREFGRFESVRGHGRRGGARAGGGPFPVVLLSPGGNVSHYWHTALAEELASHGYLVASLAHAYSGLDVFPAGGLLHSIDWNLDADDPLEARRADDRLADILAADARFVLDRLLAMSDTLGPLQGLADPDRIAIIGHSRGGSTVGRACATDPRFDACIILDNIGPDREAEAGLDRPQMTIRSADWSAERVTRLHSFLDRNRSEAWDVAVQGTSHMSFTDLPLIGLDAGQGMGAARAHRIMADLVLAFLDRHLQDRRDLDLGAVARDLPEVRATPLGGAR